MRCSAPRSRRRPHERRALRRRYGLGTPLQCPRAPDDGRAGALLRRAGASQERPPHPDDERHRPRARGRAVGGGGGPPRPSHPRRPGPRGGGWLGVRRPRPRADFRRVPLAPHNVPIVLLGAGLLWFGWFGFNAGSALAANGLATLAFVNTNTAAATALVTWALLDLFRGGRITAVGAATGLVVGLVGITPAAGYVTPLAALVIGAVAAGVSYTAIQIRSASRLDDALDVFSCHGLAGATGALLTGVFATTAANPAGANGLLAGNAAQLGVQLLAVVPAAAFAASGTAVILKFLQVTIGARAGVSEELAGLDLSEHGEEAYFGTDLGSLAGPGSALGGSVIVHAREPATVT